MTVQFLEVADYSALSLRAAAIVAGLLLARPDATVIPATGATPMALYRELGRKVEAGELDTSQIRVFQLDEYVGVPARDARSLYRWMDGSFLRPLRVDNDRVVRLDGMAVDISRACREYDRQVMEAGGIDIAVLGLGTNGHLGYNEPPCERDAPTREVVLTPESLQSASAYFDGAGVPPRALTAGMSQLLAARRILLLASGGHKREILRRAVFGPVGPNVPASWLQTVPNVTVVADAAAMGEGPP